MAVHCKLGFYAVEGPGQSHHARPHDCAAMSLSNPDLALFISCDEPKGRIVPGKISSCLIRSAEAPQTETYEERWCSSGTNRRADSSYADMMWKLFGFPGVASNTNARGQTLHRWVFLLV